jgi:predicted nucleic acid-binding protein
MVNLMKIVVNSSPVIFLAHLGFLDTVVDSFPHLILPQWVVDEIAVKHDDVHTEVQHYLHAGHLDVKQPTLRSFVNTLHQRLGKGESEAIALALEIQADRILLDDAAARKEAMRLGLTVRGTLGIIKHLHARGRIQLDDLDAFYGKLLGIQFRVKRRIFDEIFRP